MPDLISLVLLLTALTLAGSVLAWQFLTGVPPMPARSDETADVVALLNQVGLPHDAIIYELGSGWGTLVVALAKAFPQARIRGIELSPLPYWIARLRTRRMSNVSLRRANFFDCDLSDANAVTCYLMIKPMPRVAALLDRTLAPQTPVVALTFAFRERQAIKVRSGHGLRGRASLYLWPARPAPSQIQAIQRIAEP